MKNVSKAFGVILCSALLFSCGDNENTGPGQMDTSVIGYWEGRIDPVFVFDGMRFFTRISGSDSTFRLVSLSLDTASTSSDTTLDMAGKWRMNSVRDSILLLPDTCRIIDTAKNILVPREVKGSIIPLPVAISKNSTTGDIEWAMSFAELIPIAPLLGIDLSGFPSEVLAGFKNSRITLFKRSQ